MGSGLAHYPRSPLSGRFYRIIYRQHRADLLNGVLSPEGRFHHDNQPALYMSSRPDWACHAVQRYVRPDDPERVICSIDVSNAAVLDLRNAEHCAAWSVDPALATVPWLNERARGDAATAWRVSDAVRAQGMIYTARSEPTRWHVVLFNWSGPSGARLSTGTETLPYSCAQTFSVSR